MNGKEQFDEVEGLEGEAPDATSLGPPVSPFTTTAHRVADPSDPARGPDPAADPPSDGASEVPAP